MSHSAELDPAIGLPFSAADLLIPLFINAASGDVVLARQMAISGIDAYQPETRADYINLARTISFSLAALALLGQAVSPDMPMAEKMRTFTRANALNRSADQSERTMMQRRRYQRSTPTAEPPKPLEPETHSVEAEMQAAVDDAISKCVAASAEATLAAPTAASDIDAVPPRADPARLPAAATPIRHIITKDKPGMSRSALLKQELLRTSAMQPTVPPGLDTHSTRNPYLPPLDQHPVQPRPPGR